MQADIQTSASQCGAVLRKAYSLSRVYCGPPQSQNLLHSVAVSSGHADTGSLWYREEEEKETATRALCYGLDLSFLATPSQA